MTARHLRKRIVREARQLVTRHFDVEGQTNTCLYLAAAACMVAQKHGLRLILQAGSARWPRVTDQTDDGVEPNVFEYVWESDHPASRAARAAGLMPEMHVWAADPAANEVVDLTTGFWPAQCREILGVDWKAPNPPPYFWGPVDRLPTLACYEPNLEATMLADAFVRRELRRRERELLDFQTLTP